MKLNNKGVSLVEVVVYMVVSIFIIGYLFNTMSNITKSFSSEKKKINLQMDGQDAISMLARDIATTGFKHYLRQETVSGRTTFVLDTIPGTWLASYGIANYANNRPDSAIYEASFIASHGEYDDDLTIYRAKMTDPYTIDRIEMINYFLKMDSWELVRTIDTFPLNGTQFNDWALADSVVLAQDVRALKFAYSEDYQTWESDPENPQLISYVKIKILKKSDKEGNILNNPSFVFETEDDTVSFSPGADNKHFYRLYERIVEVPSNGRI